MKKLGALVGLLVCFLAISVAGATSVDVSWNGQGAIDIYAENHGNFGAFVGEGDYITGEFHAVDDRRYIDTEVYAWGADAYFEFSGVQKLAGYTDNSAGVLIFASGDAAGVNIRFDQSMYRVELERVVNSEPLIAAEGGFYTLGLGVALFDDSDDISAGYYIEVMGIDGIAAIGTNQWHPTAVIGYGWGNPDVIHAPDQPGYYTPINYVYAEGYGTVIERGFGEHYVNWNGYEMPNGGEFEFTALYDGAFYGNPDVTVY
ncbi:MAG: hypothetical protein ACXQS2_01470 [Methermicoccaceae archaeon]